MERHREAPAERTSDRKTRSADGRQALDAAAHLLVQRIDRLALVTEPLQVHGGDD